MTSQRSKNTAEAVVFAHMFAHFNIERLISIKDLPYDL